MITGGKGFLGRNLATYLRSFDDLQVETFDQEDTWETLELSLKKADVIFHLAGANRPKNEEEFDQVNRGLTEQIADLITEQKLSPIVVFSSSTQATLDNPYGRSKKAAEEVLTQLDRNSDATVFLYRLSNLFGKWCRPNYNSVVATFCHNIAHDLPIQVNDPNWEITLTYVDDIFITWKAVVDGAVALSPELFYEVEETQTITLGDLADTIKAFKASRQNLFLPNFDNPLVKKLYTTYLSYLDKKDFSYPLEERVDERGRLIELFKSQSFGQVFVSTTKGGITRGNHYHHTKVEKFFVVKGDAVIRFRQIEGDEVLEYPVSGEKPEVLDIPPGYTHSIENITDEELIVLFWANEPFDPQNPDTYFSQVMQ